MKTITCFMSMVLLVACSAGKTRETERLDRSSVVMYDSIESRMPGHLLVSLPYVIWTDPLSQENQVHVIDAEKKREVAAFLNIGNGPEEFNTPSFSVAANHELIAYDMNLNKVARFSLDNVAQGKSPLMNASVMETKGLTRIVETGNGSYVYLKPKDRQPFQTDKGVYFGKYPFDEEAENNYNVSQGNIAYNPQIGYFIYSAMSAPYIAAYQKKGNDFTLLWEKKGEMDYSLSDKKIVLDRKRTGAMELALTKDYIVTLQRDYVNDATDESKVGRDFTKLPQTLFLYDYTTGDLLKILHLHLPILRIAADIRSNTVYAIAVNPDFVMVKCELPVR